MKTKNKIFFAVLLLIVAVVFALVYMNYDYIKFEVADYINVYGYPVLFVLALVLEAVEQPIGAEVPGIVGVLFGLNYYFVILFVLLGTYISSFVNFYIGRRYFSKKVEGSCSFKEYGGYCNLFRKYGKLGLAVSALSPLPYVVFVWLSGAFHMKTRDFVLYALLPKTIRLIFLISIAGLAATWF